VVNLVRTVLLAKFICCCWRSPWCHCHVTHTPKCNELAKIRANYNLLLIIINCGLTILIVSLFSLCRLRIRTQLRFGTVDKSNWPVFLQNASGNPNSQCNL